MRTWLNNLWENIRGSLWFLPSAFIVLSIALGVIVTWIDEWYAEAEFYRNIDFLYRSGADNSLAILTTIAASVMTVASVSFSITIVSLTLASSQFGPRLLRNFMRSFVSQSIIGTFTGTFVYCLVVMRSVGTSWEEGSPHLSITVAVGLAIICVCLLIYFVHHVATSIQADSLVAGVYKELESAIESLEEDTGEDRSVSTDGAREQAADALAIRSPRSGYLLAIDSAHLAEWAEKRDCALIFALRPGGFLAKGDEVAWVKDCPSSVESAEIEKVVKDSVYMGRKRSPEQDIEYTFSQLVEIAVRALSPSINDPKTAEVCIDYLVAALCQLSNRQLPLRERRDGGGKLRILIPGTDFAGIVDESFNRIRQTCDAHPSVVIRLISGCARIARRLANRPDRREAVDAQIRQIEAIVEKLDLVEKDRREIDERIRLFHASGRPERAEQTPD